MFHAIRHALRKVFDRFLNEKIAALIANIVSLIIDKHSLYDRLKVQILHDAYHEKENTNLQTTKLPDLPS